MQITIFGLGKMGGQIARRLYKNGFNVVVWNRSEEPRREFEKFVDENTHTPAARRRRAYGEIGELIASLEAVPRVFWLMLPQEITGEFLQNQLGPHLQAGDIVIDGGNSFYKESIKRAEGLRAKGVVFYDCGTSGGVWGEKNGFALMVGGPKEQWGVAEPVFKALSGGPDATVGGAGNYGLVGKNGAGHFVKMVHNGIEYGMMEAIAEGYGVLKASDFNLDLNQVTKIYQEGTVIRSWLIDLTANIFDREDVEGTSGVIKATGEGEWTVNAGQELGVDVRVIKDALDVRKESAEPKNQNKFSNKIIALLRKQFGGHGVEGK
jgi:6-phosphogluconate dehydrogenase